ncbi:MAG TPA: DUF3137 domain-containing protein [Dongiaceae bacterium]|jgi:hypothetical protein|nr:DUF3137 domain-containing protein [Dongiaceae bacterium]
MDGGILNFILLAGVIIVVTVLGAFADYKRREALQALAARLGLSFSADRDDDLAAEYGFLDQWAHGSNSYAFNVLSGRYADQSVRVFDYHYESYTTSSKDSRQNQHHDLSFFVLTLPQDFPELKISREGWFSKVAQAFGYADIDFESAEFSRAFCVRSPDKKFAYDICNPQMMEYLLANRDLNIEIEHQALALSFSGKMDVETIEPNLQRLLEIRRRFPEYLFNST